MKLIRPSVEALTAYTPGEQLSLPGLIKLNTNENPYPPSPAVDRAIRDFSPATLRLYPDPLCSALRQRLAALHQCSPKAIFIGNGSDEVLRLVTRAFTRPGGAAASFHPSYSLYPVLAAAEEIAFHRVELAPGFQWTPPPANAPFSLFFLTNPNAPTGIHYPLPAIEAFCRSFSGTVLIDEAYADFSEAPSCIPLALSLPNTLVCRTLSKSFSLAGLRLGYAVGPIPLIAALYKIKDSYNIDALSQAIALAALSDLPWMHANAAKILRTRDRIATELSHREWSIVPSSTNFLFAAPPPDSSAADLFRSLREHRILVRHFPGPRTGDHLRITIGTDADMDIFLNTLSHL